MEIQDEYLGKHAAVLQVLADQLRTLESTGTVGPLEQYSVALESVAASLICERLIPHEALP